MPSQEEESELIEFYERKVRRGFPCGEVRYELLKKGYSEIEAERLLQILDQRFITKSKEREKRFRFFYSILLISIGTVLYLMTGRIGLWFICSGVIRLFYEIYTEWSRKDMPASNA